MKKNAFKNMIRKRKRSGAFHLNRNEDILTKSLYIEKNLDPYIKTEKRDLFQIRSDLFNFKKKVVAEI